MPHRGAWAQAGSPFRYDDDVSAYASPDALVSLYGALKFIPLGASGAASRFDADGRLTDEATRKLLAQLLTALRDWTHRLGARP